MLRHEEAHPHTLQVSSSGAAAKCFSKGNTLCVARVRRAALAVLGKYMQIVMCVASPWVSAARPPISPFSRQNEGTPRSVPHLPFGQVFMCGYISMTTAYFNVNLIFK